MHYLVTDYVSLVVWDFFLKKNTPKINKQNQQHIQKPTPPQKLEAITWFSPQKGLALELIMVA